MAQAVGRQKFDRWFGSARMRLDNGALDIAVPNRFVADWIDNHFHDQMLEVAQDTLGEGAAVRVHIEPAAKGGRNGSAQAPQGGTNGSAVGRRSSGADASSAAPVSGDRAASAVNGRQGPSQSRLAELRYDLDDFIVGPSNELAYTASRQLIDEAPAHMNPLFIHGGCGLGKTHLLQGLCRRYAEENPGARWRYTSAEQFTNEFVHAIRSNKLNAFRQKLRRLDLLAVDDVHFLSSKSATQTEFLHTFDAIDLHGAKVVLASDAHPKLIREFADALVSRFMSGMVVQVEPPDRMTRVRLIGALARRRGLVLVDGVVDALAAQTSGSIREIEGLLTKLAALATLQGNQRSAAATIGHALVHRLFGEGGAERTSRKPIRLEHIVRTICRELNVEQAQVSGRNRHRRVVLARSIIIYLAREMTTLSYPELARALGRSNHSTIVTAAQRIEHQIRQRQPNPILESTGSATIDQLVDRLRRQVTDTAGGDRR